ncbi:MAG: hypothetical protein Q8M98_10190 [Candidatus Cloacimonadaceae bacterium]|nr:hypothetical protein [Candidatus Cloacimonadaceae bacterium]MDP3115123.1 hypothetical protein [Candidatus Cloacimonadaceae bacterium]
MKKVIAILICVMLAGMVFAIEFKQDGVFRARAAIYNDLNEEDGGHLDNRLQFGLNAELHEYLNMYGKVEIGNLTWGTDGGAITTSGVNIKTFELYIDYRIESLMANVKIGQQWWSDHRGLILNDTFSGIVFTMDNCMSFKTQVGWIKANERWKNKSDDYNVFLINAQTDSPMPAGVLFMYGRDDNPAFEMSNITFMPYVTVKNDPIELDLTGFVDYQMYTSPIDSELSFGAAAKANMDLGMMQIGADILYVSEKGLTTLSPYYQNGLYIYGYGPHHDGVNLYWGNYNAPQNANFLSAVASVRMPLNDSMTAFGAFGLLIDTGMEINAGIEINLIPDLLKLSGYGAYGIHESETKNYMFGTTIKTSF